MDCGDGSKDGKLWGMGLGIDVCGFGGKMYLADKVVLEEAAGNNC